jgi:hypothetical protein
MLAGEPNEETLVRRRVTTPIAPPPLPVQMPPTAASFNPWKVLIPSMIGLLVIFAVIYAFTRNSQPSAAPQPGPTLAADPNSQPVEPAQPPTGQAEVAIPAGGATNQNQNANQNPNASTSASPSPAENPNDIGSVNLNANDNANQNANSRKAPPVALPSPTAQIEEPPPSPAVTKPPTPKPSLPPPVVSPSGNLR